MLYVPIIKLKKYEILNAKYFKRFLNHKDIIPFLELRYSLKEKKKNCHLNDFLKVTGINNFFLGIPHKKSAIKINGSSDKDNYIVQANKNIKTYYNEVINLFDVENAIPVFYVYDNNDLEYLSEFINYARDFNRKIGIITTPKIAKTFDEKNIEINMSDYLLIDLESESIISQKVNLEIITKNTRCKVILIRENRSLGTNNTSLEDNEQSPLLNDLSTEFNEVNERKIRIIINGFGDYCGQKNDISTSAGGNKQEKYPATALYIKEDNPNYFYTIKSDIPVSDGFLDLKEKAIERINIIDKNNITQINEILNELSMKTYAFWHILEESCYLAKMYYYDDWKNIVVKNF